MPRPRAACGTEAAYRRHLRNHEPVDDACRDAHANERRGDRRSPTAKTPHVTAPATPPADQSDMELIVSTLRTVFVKVAEADPTKLAPIAREFRTAVQATSGPVEQPKEASLADQLAEARAARAARAAGSDAAG